MQMLFRCECDEYTAYALDHYFFHAISKANFEWIGRSSVFEKHQKYGENHGEYTLELIKIMLRGIDFVA